MTRYDPMTLEVDRLAARLTQFGVDPTQAEQFARSLANQVPDARARFDAKADALEARHAADLAQAKATFDGALAAARDDMMAEVERHRAWAQGEIATLAAREAATRRRLSGALCLVGGFAAAHVVATMLM